MKHILKTITLLLLTAPAFSKDAGSCSSTGNIGIENRILISDTVPDVPAPASACTSSIVISDLTPFNFDANNQGSVSGYVTISTSGNVVLPLSPTAASGYVVATQEIHLTPGFSAPKGVAMRFYLDPASCTTVALRPAAPAAAPVYTNSIIVYPNPCIGSFNLKSDFAATDNGEVKYTLLSADGRLLKAGVLLAKATARIDVAGYARGIYFLKAVNKATGYIAIKRIVVQ